MAIVINANDGTISGISVGGLPDGTVDAGTLATNSVDSAELIDGAVDDSHIAALAASKLTGALPAISGASLTGLTTAQMPTGTVLQVVSFQHGTSQNITTTTDTTLTDWDFTITKKQNNSRIYCSMQFYMYYSSSPTYWWIKAYANGSYVTSNSSWKNDVATNNNQQYTHWTAAHQQFNAQFYDDTNAAQVQFTFKVNQNASGNLTSWGAGTSNTFFFTEVAV